MERTKSIPKVLKVLWVINGILIIVGLLIMWSPVELDQRIVWIAQWVIIPIGELLTGVAFGIGLIVAWRLLR